LTDQRNQHHDEDAGEMIGDFLQRHDPEAVQGRAFTPHGVLLHGSGSSGYRSPPGSALRPTSAATGRRLQPLPPRLPAERHSRPGAETGSLRPPRPAAPREWRQNGPQGPAPPPCPPPANPPPPPHRPAH